MRDAHLIAWALSHPWALMPERMAAYASVLASHYAGNLPAAAPKAVSPSTSAARARSGRGGNIAVINVFGAMVEWPGDIDACEGGTASAVVSQQLTDAEKDESVAQVLMVFNTPGGSVYGTAELGDVINRVKASKPVIGVAQSLAASAGYWLLSQCTEAYCSPGGEVGSIGVYSGYQNIAKAMEMAGVDIQLFSAGKYKTELSPFSDGLSPDAVAYQEQRAQEYYAMFTKAVAKGRKVPVASVRNGMGQGRVLGAQAALEAGMIDGIASIDVVVGRMQRGVRTGNLGRSSQLGPRRMSVEAMRREIDILSI
ncbi:S49 family peptidase [Burkholderia ubonensis]|uniref:S49 family peptidase n=1 Tax=Burkholderia ubonensis TaxID=101571 RepID=UPI0007C761F0|nr:S49 family peptidase [Burkholderia ubonensis]